MRCLSRLGQTSHRVWTSKSIEPVVLLQLTGASGRPVAVLRLTCYINCVLNLSPSFPEGCVARCTVVRKRNGHKILPSLVCTAFGGVQILEESSLAKLPAEPSFRDIFLVCAEVTQIHGKCYILVHYLVFCMLLFSFFWVKFEQRSFRTLPFMDNARDICAFELECH